MEEKIIDNGADSVESDLDIVSIVSVNTVRQFAVVFERRSSLERPLQACVLSRFMVLTEASNMPHE